jgi:hypothetical protein
MKPPPSNVAHSVRTRLLTFAKAADEEFNYVLIRYALERFLVRLSHSHHRDTFILKGAMLFRTWSPRTHRPTKDLDLLGRGSPEPARLAAQFAEMCAVEVGDDGMVFDAKSVKAARIKEDAEYEGVRVTFKGTPRNRAPQSPGRCGFWRRGEPGTYRDRVSDHAPHDRPEAPCVQARDGRRGEAPGDG